MHRKFVSRVGLFVLSGLVGLSLPISAGAQTAKKTTPAAKPAQTTAKKTTAPKPAAKPAAKAPPAKKPAYSASRSQSRKNKLSSARAQANAREAANAAIPRYRVDAAGELVPDLRAAAAIIWNPETNQVLWEENSTTQRSIASITKVMTATVFLENNPDLTEKVAVVRDDVYRASTTHLRASDRVTTGDLLHLLLIASDNAAARALARVSPLGTQGFIRRMNEKAVELGLTSTHYVDTSGLLNDNLSSALDMARLITHASADERISSVMRTQQYTIDTGRRKINFHSTNQLLGRSDVDVRAGKTGFITKAGYCLATFLRLPQNGQQVAVVVLGARSNAGRFLETQNLFSWLSNKAATIFATQTTGSQNE